MLVRACETLIIAKWLSCAVSYAISVPLGTESTILSHMAGAGVGGGVGYQCPHSCLVIKGVRGFVLKLRLYSKHTAFPSMCIYLNGGKVVGGRGQME